MADDLLRIIAGRDSTGLIEVRCRSPRTGEIEARRWFPLDSRDPARRFIVDCSDQRGLDVYVGVAPRTERAGGKAHIRHSWLLYVDADTADAAARVRAFVPRPTLIVRSGTGDNVHAYWSLTEPLSPAWFERANRRLSYRLGADLKVTDAARILRPPGSLNHKTTPPVRVTIEHVSHGVTIPVARIVGHLPDPPNVRAARTPRADIAETDDPLQGISADRYYATLTGREVTRGNVRCPFPSHRGGAETSPSMRLYETTFYCFGCCVGGGIYQFAEALWGLERRGRGFVELRDRLARELT